MKLPQKPSYNNVGVITSILISWFLVIVIAFLLRMIMNTFTTFAPEYTFGYVVRRVVGIEMVHAAGEYPVQDDRYRARYVDQSIPDPITVKGGETKTILVRFRNTGSQSWNSTGNGRVTAFTIEPKYRASQFRGSDWDGPDQTATIKEDVAPGGVGVLPVQIIAPKIPGTYRERFHLAAYNQTWIPGGEFYLDIVVTPVSQEAVPAAPVLDPPVVQPSPTLPTYRGKRISQSKRSIEVSGGEPFSLILGYRNTGSKPWNEYLFVTPTKDGDVALSSMGHESWVNQSVILKKTATVAPEEYIRERVTLRAPKEKGVYTFTLYVAAGGSVLHDTKTTVTVTVSEDAPFFYTPPVLSKESQEFFVTRLEQEPSIRVGLWQPDDVVEFRSADQYRVLVNGEEKGVLEKDEQVTFGILPSTLLIQSPTVNLEASGVVRFEPIASPHALFELPNFDRRLNKNGTNYNEYRGIVELRQGKNDGLWWVINETLLDDYVAGIAETGNTSPAEYQKALQTAARSYAYAMVMCKCKYGVFDVLPSTADQLFLGVKIERERPNLLAATQETSGYMVSYDTDAHPSTPSVVVSTPYFSNSDGMTRSSKQVWGGSEKPWLAPVEATYDKRDGKKMYGHGVGMSNRDAILRASEGGALWQDILRYYYTGVQIEKWY